MKYIGFEEATSFVQKLKLKSCKEWQKYCKSGNKPDCIPSYPDSKYKNQWKGYHEWLGNGKLKRGRLYSVNYDFFKVWSPDMAYVLGLWWADGWIYNNRFSIIIKTSDSYILEQINTLMESTYHVYTYENINAKILSINSREIVSDIKKIGGVERKSKICIMPQIPQEYFPDFLRGLWDGDGSIWYANKYAQSSLTSGSLCFLKDLFKCIKNQVPDIKGGFIVEKRQTRGNKNYLNYDLRFSTNDSRALRNYMYKDKNKIMLYRKYELFVKAGKIKRTLSFEEARNKAKTLKIKSSFQWRNGFDYKKHGLTDRPDQTYKNRGWKGWKDFLQ